MRRRLCALMMMLPLLAGCGAGEKQDYSADELALTIRGEYLAMTACSAVMEVTADYGQRVYEYTLAVQWQKGGETVLTVLAPESIAGITARLRSGTGRLEYDGASLETGELGTEGLSPMEVVPAAMEQIISGFMAQCAMETVDDRPMLWFCCRDPEASPGSGTEYAFWFDARSHTLTRAEVCSDGYTVMGCTFTDFAKE